eukprot:523504-Pyramimonas_sp.AAC.1
MTQARRPASLRPVVEPLRYIDAPGVASSRPSAGSQWRAGLLSSGRRANRDQRPLDQRPASGTRSDGWEESGREGVAVEGSR